MTAPEHAMPDQLCKSCKIHQLEADAAAKGIALKQTIDALKAVGMSKKHPLLETAESALALNSGQALLERLQASERVGEERRKMLEFIDKESNKADGLDMDSKTVNKLRELAKA